MMDTAVMVIGIVAQATAQWSIARRGISSWTAMGALFAIRDPPHPASGTVERCANLSDRRSVHVKITELGRSELRKAWAVDRRGIDDHFGERLSDGEAAKLRDLLRKVAPSEDEAR